MHAAAPLTSSLSNNIGHGHSAMSSSCGSQSQYPAASPSAPPPPPSASSSDSASTLGTAPPSGPSMPSLSTRRESDGRPSVPRLETGNLGFRQPLSGSRNAIFGLGASPSGHVRTPSGSSQIESAGSPFSFSSLGSTSALSADASGADELSQSGSLGRRSAGPMSSGELQTPGAPGAALSTSSSVRSRRNWEEFDGQYITALPSPSVSHDNVSSYLDSPSRPTELADKSSLSPGSALGRGRSSSPAAPETSQPPETPSKTSAFFGTSWSAAPSSSKSPAQSQTNRSSSPSAVDRPMLSQASASSPLSAFNLPSNVPRRLYEPARLPSMPFHGQMISGTSVENASLVAAAPVRGHHRVSSNESSSGSEASFILPYTERPISPAFSMGSDTRQGPSPSPALHTSVSSPLRTQFSTLPSDLGAPSTQREPVQQQPRLPHNPCFRVANEANTNTNTNAITLSVPGREAYSQAQPQAQPQNPGRPRTMPAATLMPPGAASRRTSTSRHVHGPSENATGSSLSPPVVCAATRSEPECGDVGDRVDAELAQPLEEEDESAGRVGPYQIVRTLGVGAFSRVVLARGTSAKGARTGAGAVNGEGSASKAAANAAANSEREESDAEGLVALKMIDREPCDQNERMRVSWVREVEVLKHISHPCLVRFISSFSTPLHHTLVLERVGGGELFDLLARYQLEIAKREWLVRRLFAELAGAVGWMHEINLVHRDIKLENILLTHDLFGPSFGALTPSTLPPTPLLKLTDFGLSRFVGPSGPLLETRCGSEEYAAPELIIGKRYDGRKTDVWALGVVLYALLTGAIPFLDDGDRAGGGGGVVPREREGAGAAEGRDGRERKAHLLRIAKGDLRWPINGNEQCADGYGLDEEGECLLACRLVTPQARKIVGRLLRRDPTKRAMAWDAWDEEWLISGSFGSREQTQTGGQGGAGESSMRGERFEVPPDPRGAEGRKWIRKYTSVKSAEVDDIAARDE